MPQDPALTIKKLAIYARVSTDEQKEGQTINSQIAELERFARERGWEIVGVYKDEGFSGAVMARPALDKLRDDAAKRLFDAVLLNDVDRLARDVAHLGVIKRDFEKKGVAVIFRKLPAESSPTQNLMVNILGSFAEFERELIADRTRRGRRHKVEVKKQFLGSQSPYGYRYVPKDRSASKDGFLEVCPEEAAVVRQMFAWVANEGLSARKVLDRLNQLKLRPRKGQPAWAKSSVLRILHSEVYAGTWYYNKFQCVEPVASEGPVRYRRHLRSALRRRPKSEWIPLALPEDLRLISRQQWQRVQDQLVQNTAFSLRNSRHTYLLRGLVRCGGCSGRFVGDPCHGKFYYRCYARCKRVGTVTEERLNETVWQAVEQVMLNPDVIADGVARLRTARAATAVDTASERTELSQGLVQIEAEESRLLEAYRLGVITPAHLGQELEKLRIRRSTLQTRQAALPTTISEPPEPKVRRSIQDYCHQAAAAMAGFDEGQRQHFLRHLHISCIFTGNTVRISGRLPIGRSAETNDNTPTTDGPSGGGIAGTEIDLHARNPASMGSGLSYTTSHGPDFEISAQVLPPNRNRQLRHESGKFLVGTANTVIR